LIQKFISKLRRLYNSKMLLANCRLSALAVSLLLKKILHSASYRFNRIRFTFPKVKSSGYPIFFKEVFRSALLLINKIRSNLSKIRTSDFSKFAHNQFTRIIQSLSKLSTYPYFKKSRVLVVISSSVLIIVAIALFAAIHHRIYQPNITRTTIVFIHTGSDYQQVINTLKEKNIFRDFNSFVWFSKRKNYPSLIKPGA